MYTDFSVSATAIQIAPVYAVLLSAIIALLGVAIGTVASHWFGGREMRRNRAEVEYVRSVRDNAQNVRQQAINERERAVRELQCKVHEHGLVEAESLSLKRQLDHSQASLRTTESQLEEMKAIVRASKRNSEEAQSELSTMEEQWNGKNQNIARLQAQIKDLQGGLDESRKQLNERYLTITALNAQLQEYRSRANESNGVVSNLQTVFAELSRRLQHQTIKMAETDVRTTDAQFHAAQYADVPLLTPNVSMPATQNPETGMQTFAARRAPDRAQHAEAAATAHDDVSQLETQLVSMLSELKPA